MSDSRQSPAGDSGRPQRKDNQGEAPAVLPPPTTPPDGPAKVLATKATGDFKGCNPFALKRTLGALCGIVEDAKATRDGALLIVTTDRAQTEDLLKGKTLGGGVPVTVALSEKVKSVMAVCRSDDLTGMTHAELLDELKAQGVCRVERLRSRNAAEWGPYPTIKQFLRQYFVQHLRPLVIADLPRNDQL